jgi:hypothetical protein
MRTVIISLITGLIIFCISMGLSAQSFEEELDQAELMKQFIGDWKTEYAPDTFIYWHISPNENGYIESGEFQTKGKTLASWQGIIGFTPNKERIQNFYLQEGGRITGDFCQFIAKNKLKVNSWNANHQVNFARGEYTFLTPDKIKDKSQYRKWDAENWDDAKAFEFIWERVKK